jgi:hypothetical protein
MLSIRAETGGLSSRRLGNRTSAHLHLLVDNTLNRPLRCKAACAQA